MICIRYTAVAVILAGAIGSGVAFAQTSTKAKDTMSPPASTTSKDSKSDSTLTAVENWTTKQWNAMTKEWAKDKTKWADCRKQSKEQKLSGRKSWSYLYQCMKKA